MPPELTDKPWAQIRNDYEHSDRHVEDICAEHGISSGTLRDRVRRWGWTRRRAPIPREGPPPTPAPLAPTLYPSPACGGGEGGGPALRESDMAAPSLAMIAPRAVPTLYPSPACGGGTGGGAPVEPDDRPIGPRLQGAVARVLPAIEATLTRLGAEPMHPREMERAARALAVLTRTLRELNSLLRQHAADEAARLEKSVDVETLRRDLALKLEAIVGAQDDAAGPAS
jgi:hypothetical protein